MHFNFTLSIVQSSVLLTSSINILENRDIKMIDNFRWFRLFVCLCFVCFFFFKKKLEHTVASSKFCFQSWSQSIQQKRQLLFQTIIVLFGPINFNASGFYVGPFCNTTLFLHIIYLKKIQGRNILPSHETSKQYGFDWTLLRG